MNLVSNIQYSFRLFLKNFSTSAIAVLVLAFGLAMSLTMFAMAKMLLWDAPKFNGEQGLQAVDWVRELGDFNGFNIQGVNLLDYQEFKAKNSSFETLTGAHFLSYAVFNPDGEGAVQRYQALRVEGDFFGLVDVDPVIGRVFNNQDIKDGEFEVVVISHKLWQDEFDLDKNVLDKTLVLDGIVHKVIGVMPEGFAFPFSEHIWRPYDWKWEKPQGREGQFTVRLFGVLKEGVSTEQAKQDLAIIAQGLAQEFPETNEKLTRLKIENFDAVVANSQLRVIVYVVLIGSAFVLLIACANVSNILMARVGKRQFELAMRKVLGARKIDVAMQVIFDALIIASLGLFLAFLMAGWACRFIWNLFTENYSSMPYWWEMDIDAEVFLYGALAMICAILVSSLTPLIKILAKHSIDIIKDDSRTSSGLSSSKLGKMLVTSQIALTVVLLTLSNSFSSFLQTQQDRQLPYAPEDVLVNNLYVSHEAGFDSVESVMNFFDEVAKDVETIPGVDSVAYAYSAITFGDMLKRDFEVEGRPPISEDHKLAVSANIVSGKFFETLNGNPLLGRFFDSRDNANSQKVVVVNQNFVKEYFPDQNPIGKRIRVLKPGNEWEPQNRDKKEWTQWLTIIGVTSNIESSRGIDKAREQGNIAQYTMVYIPQRQWISRVSNILVTGQGDVKKYAKDVAKVISNKSTNLAPMFKYETLADTFNRIDLFMGLITEFVLMFGLAALVMASVGLYGIAAFTANQRKRDYGIRMALGANRKDIILHVLKTVRWQLIIGSILGFAYSFFLMTVLNQQLSNDIEPSILENIQLYGFSLLVVVVALVLAVFVPAWRMSKLQPNTALHSMA